METKESLSGNNPVASKENSASLEATKLTTLNQLSKGRTSHTIPFYSFADENEGPAPELLCPAPEPRIDIIE